jgi:hypothetical protein
MRCDPHTHAVVTPPALISLTPPLKMPSCAMESILENVLRSKASSSAW